MRAVSILSSTVTLGNKANKHTEKFVELFLKDMGSYFPRCSLFAGTCDSNHFFKNVWDGQNSLWMKLKLHLQGDKALLTVGIICDWVSHSWTSLWGSDVFLHHLFMCFSAQTIRSPDRKSPSGCTTASLPRPYITLGYKLKQLPPPSMLPCVVFFGVFALFDQSDPFIRFWLPSSSLIPTRLWCLPVKAVSIWISILCVVRTVYSPSTTSLFPSHWNVPDCMWVCERAANIRPLIGYRQGWASATHTLSAQLLSMHGQTWWLTSPPGSSRKIPPSSAEQRPWKKSGKKV